MIIDWLTKEGNYNQWQGGDKQNGMTKMGIANEISQIIKDKGITSERQGWDIHVKKIILSSIPGCERLADPGGGWCDL